MGTAAHDGGVADMSKMTNKSLWSIGRFARTSRHRLPVFSRGRRAEPQPRVGGISGEAMGRGRDVRWQSRRHSAMSAGACLAAEVAW